MEATNLPSLVQALLAAATSSDERAVVRMDAHEGLISAVYMPGFELHAPGSCGWVFSCARSRLTLYTRLHPSNLCSLGYTLPSSVAYVNLQEVSAQCVVNVLQKGEAAALASHLQAVQDVMALKVSALLAG